MASLESLAHDVDVTGAVAAREKSREVRFAKRGGGDGGRKEKKDKPRTYKVCSQPPSVFSIKTSTIVLPSGSWVGLIKSVAPIERAHSSLPGFVSIAMICFALRTRQPWMTARPTAPRPKTATLSPSWTLAVLVLFPGGADTNRQHTIPRPERCSHKVTVRTQHRNQW